MKIANVAQLARTNGKSFSPEVQDARQSFRQTKKHLAAAVDKLHEKIGEADLSRQQRIQIREAFERFNGSVKDISQAFRQSRVTNPGQYQAELGVAGRDLYAAVNDILAQREEAVTAPGSNGSGGRSGGPGINLLA